jgi:hypothetical protein
MLQGAEEKDANARSSKAGTALALGRPLRRYCDDGDISEKDGSESPTGFSSRAF